MKLIHKKNIKYIYCTICMVVLNVFSLITSRSDVKATHADELKLPRNRLPIYQKNWLKRLHIILPAISKVVVETFPCQRLPQWVTRMIYLAQFLHWMHLSQHTRLYPGLGPVAAGNQHGVSSNWMLLFAPFEPKCVVLSAFPSSRRFRFCFYNHCHHCLLRLLQIYALMDFFFFCYRLPMAVEHPTFNELCSHKMALSARLLHCA